ncbi:MAG TPA: DHA2 family efflux MFS transporter permease subunit [Acidimicrobiales bacterium]|nr:DHA2 family efflux MFS transporter permease subunit [Acidimicrobiales bacterium]
MDEPTTVAPRPGLVVGLSSLAVLAVFLDTTVLFVAFPDLVADFSDVAPTSLSWVLNAYTIVFAALLVPAGRLVDRLGRKRTFLLGLVTFTVASVVCALAPNVPLLIVARAAQAAGGSLLIPGSLALVLAAVPRERLPVAVAVWGAAGAFAGAVGPTLGAAIVELGGWRWVFVINLPIGVATWVAGRRVFAESTELTDDRVGTPLGVLLIMAPAALISLGVVQSETWGWTDARTVAALVGGALLLAAFVAHQQRSAAPVLDLSLFASVDFRWANAATIAFGVAFSAMFLSSVLFLTEVWGWSTLKAGLAITPGPALVVVLARPVGQLAARIGQRPLLLTGGVLFAIGGLWRWLLLDATPDYVGDYLPSMLFTGLGVVCCLPQLSSVAAQSLPPHRFGVGSSVNQAVRQLGQTFGVALVIGFVSGVVSLDEALAAFDRVWVLLIVGGLATSLLSLPITPRARRAGAVAPAPAAGH